MIPLLRGPAARAFIDNSILEQQAPDVSSVVTRVIADVRSRRDDALRELATRFGDPEPRLVPALERNALARTLASDESDVLRRAAANISRFAESVMAGLKPVQVEQPGFRTGMRLQPVARAACYVPAGRHPLPSTALMTGLTARAAGVPCIDIVCSQLHPAVMLAADIVGARRVYQLGGAQAIAALAYGTDIVEPVDLVVGPGNAYVTEAKRQLQGVIGIDMLAGPSEVAIIADGGASPRWVALDLLAQAEHDPNARVVLLTWDEPLALAVEAALAQELENPIYPAFLAQSLQHSALLLLESPAACALASDQLAPEHLHVAVKTPGEWRDKLHHYGGIFLGYQATVPFGDYMAGPNHTLPTNRTARFSGALSPLTFLRPQCWLEVDDAGLAADTAAFATLEGLGGHAAAARARLGH